MSGKLLLGIGLLAGAAYLYFRGQGGSSVPKSDAIKEVEREALESQAANLQKITIDDPTRIQSEISSTKDSLARLNNFLHTGIKGRGVEDIHVSTAAEVLHQSTLRNIEKQEANLQNLLLEQQSIIDNRNQTLYAIEFYNQPTLADIRQQLNSSDSL